MSNYSSLSRVLSPFRVQTKFDENTLPASYTTDIMAFCFVVGTLIESAFEVTGQARMSISALREIIYDKKKNNFKDKGFDSSDLHLWKVDIPGDVENVKLKKLERRSRDINGENTIIQELGGKKLTPFEDFGDIFAYSSSKNIRIIAQPPQPATTGKRRWDFGDGNEDRDRKKGKLTVPETILTCAQKIMEDIKKLSENSKDYSNPENILSLPFPFPGKRKPVERFSIIDGKFRYMGRKMFDDVLDKILGLAIGDSFMDCFIYGTIGYGKSYILATIACFLLRTGKRVVYLPDCRELAKDPEDYIKLALILAYTDNIEKINEISACKTTDDIVAFCKSSEPLYFIVDQMNALDYRNNTEIVEGKKVAILDILNRMTSEHYYVKSSSANNKSALYLMQKQTNDKKIELYGGFNEDEMSQWWIHNGENLPLVNKEQKTKIEYDTGKNPLFLSILLGSEKNFEDALVRLKKTLIDKIQEPMTNFSEIISGNGRWDLHVKLMSSCLTNGYTPFGYGTNDYDHRFFYIDDNICHCSSGFVRDCMADYLFEKGRLEVFTDSTWIQSIKEFKNNPSVMGFMVEKACLSSIFKNGFMANTINFRPGNYKFFTSIQEINFSMNEGPCTFYLPRRWNQKSIDGLITFHKLQNKKEKVEEDTLYIVPIQITFDKDTHSDSESSFFSGIWPELKSKIPSDLRVEVIFIWITRKSGEGYFVEAKEKILKGRTIEINPQYTSIVMAFRSINIELEDILPY